MSRARTLVTGVIGSDTHIVGNRILLLSPHPGQVKGELNSDGSDRSDPASGCKLSDRIHDMLFADRIEEQEVLPHG